MILEDVPATESTEYHSQNETMSHLDVLKHTDVSKCDKALLQKDDELCKDMYSY